MWNWRSTHGRSCSPWKPAAVLNKDQSYFPQFQFFSARLPLMLKSSHKHTHTSLYSLKPQFSTHNLDITKLASSEKSSSLGKLLLGERWKHGTKVKQKCGKMRLKQCTEFREMHAQHGNMWRDVGNARGTREQSFFCFAWDFYLYFLKWKAYAPQCPPSDHTTSYSPMLTEQSLPRVQDGDRKRLRRFWRDFDDQWGATSAKLWSSTNLLASRIHPTT